jgi:RHS repeat-associated protein
MLKAVRNPQGDWIRFEYDALGRRTAKIVHTKIYRYLWDGNVLLHEWHYERARRPKVITDELGMLILDRPEPVENLTTWVYEEGSLVPTAKLCEGKSYSIVSDYLGRPAQVYDDKGELVWQVEFDIYGRIREDTFNNQPFIPFRQLGQYEDVETGLFYNRFRYYHPKSGLYISQDPIGLAGNNPNFYAYVHDSNVWVAPFGLMADFPTNIDFTGHPDLFPSEGAIVKIKMQGSRGRDFTEAFKKSGIDRKLADDYTWHHVADFDPTTGETTMQLIKTDIHKATIPHKGSVYQFEAEFGVKYGTPAAINKAKAKGWVKCKN